MDVVVECILSNSHLLVHTQLQLTATYRHIVFFVPIINGQIWCGVGGGEAGIRSSIPLHGGAVLHFTLGTKSDIHSNKVLKTVCQLCCHQ